MEGTFSRKLQVWNDGPAAPESRAALDMPARPLLVSEASPVNAQGLEQLFNAEALIPPGQKVRHKALEPFTLQWFLEVEKQRYDRHGSWIPRLLEFQKHAGETVLGMGMGIGTDWVQFARNAANVVVSSASVGQLGLIKRNFEVRNLKGRFIHTHLQPLPMDSATVDVAVINALGQSIESVASLDEINRVLKPGGKVILVAASSYDIEFWVHKVLVWRDWLGLNRREYDASIVRYSGRDLMRIFASFVDQRTHRRQLRRSEVPHGWRWLPLPVLTRIAGRALVFKAFKPLSVILPASAAA